MSNYYNESMFYTCINGYYRSRECLKHFIVVLTQRKLLKELCDFTYCRLEEEVSNMLYIHVITLSLIAF